jgi:hypothetical protein
MPKVLIVTGDAAESLEVMHSHQRLTEEGLPGRHRRSVSARAWPDHPAWMRELIQILRSKAPT